MLCDTCSVALRAPEISEYPIDKLRDFRQDRGFRVVHSDFASLLASLEAQCGLCHRLVKYCMHVDARPTKIFATLLTLKANVDPDDFSVRYRLAYESHTRRAISLHAIFRSRTHTIQSTSALVEGPSRKATPKLSWDVVEEKAYVFLCLAPEQVPLTSNPSLQVHNGTASKSMNVLLSWIQNCRDHHIQCKRTSLPRTRRRFARILDVGAGDNVPHVRLLSSDQLPRDLTYATLSHCWGGTASSIPSLTTRNYDHYLQSIDIATLPLTFRDAINLTRRISIRYLWIDSLCIIQDSSEDWLDQAAVMGEVYQSSYLNIAATKSNNAHGGLFTARNAAVANPTRIGIWAQVPDAEDSASLPSLQLQGSYLVRTQAPQRLEGRSTLVASYTDKLPQAVDLDKLLGNENGGFDIQGKNFTATARNLMLSDSMLSAELRMRNGQWREDSIDIAPLVKDRWHRSAICGSGFSRAQLFYDLNTLYYDIWKQQVFDTKLASRGWIVQERLLAPRVVHFAAEQLIWECTESRALEAHPGVAIDPNQPAAISNGLDFKSMDLFSPDLIQEPKQRDLGVGYIWAALKAMYDRDIVTFRKVDLADDAGIRNCAKQMCFGNDDWTPMHNLIKCWSRIIIGYSSSDLTYKTDRLIAISGLARILSMRTNEAYVAGLWAKQLPRQLLWNYSCTHFEMAPEYVAPSWSWAAYSLALSAAGLRLEPSLEADGAMDLIQILSIELEGVDENDFLPFGRLKRGGRLRIQGRLIPIALDPEDWPEGVVSEEALVEYWSASWPELPERQTFLLPVLFIQWNERLPLTTPNSLLLEWTGNKGVYRRIGTARLSPTYPLNYVVPELYKARKFHHEDNDDDDGDIKAEADDGNAEIVYGQTDSSRIVPSPQQEIANRAQSAIDLYDLDILAKFMDWTIAAAVRRDTQGPAGYRHLFANVVTRYASRYQRAHSQSLGDIAKLRDLPTLIRFAGHEMAHLVNTVPTTFSERQSFEFDLKRLSFVGAKLRMLMLQSPRRPEAERPTESQRQQAWMMLGSERPSDRGAVLASDQRSQIVAGPNASTRQPEMDIWRRLEAVCQGEFNPEMMNALRFGIQLMRRVELSSKEEQKRARDVYTGQELPKLSPRDAVSDEFYLQRVEDDQRFGCFVFDII